MKKSLTALAVLGSIVGTASAQSSVTLFGILDAAVRHVKNDSVGSKTSMVSGSNSTSRLGLRGTEDLGGGLSASFWLESDVIVDSGIGGKEGGPFWNRRSTVSLASARLGEIRLGRDYTPTHHASCGFDAFGCVGVANVYVLRTTQASALSTARGLGNTAPLTRANNSVNYYSPNFGGFLVQLMAALPEGSITGAVENSKLVGARIGYKRGPVNVQAATIQIRNTPQAGATFKDAALGATYDFKVATAYFHYRQQTIKAEKLATIGTSVSVPFGPHEFLAKYQRMNQSGATPANDGSLIGLGYVYNLSKRTALYATWAQVDNKGTGSIAIPGGPAVTAATFGGKKSTGYEAGLRHNF